MVFKYRETKSGFMIWIWLDLVHFVDLEMCITATEKMVSKSGSTVFCMQNLLDLPKISRLGLLYLGGLRTRWPLFRQFFSVLGSREASNYHSVIGVFKS